MIVTGPLFSVVLALALLWGNKEASSAVSRTEMVTVTLPDWASAAVCTVSGDAQPRGGLVAIEPLGRGHTQTLSFTCPAPADRILSCAGSGVEPIDVSVSDVCRSRRVPLNAAVDVAVSVAGPMTLTIEWLDMTNDGARRLAWRSAVVERSVSVPVASIADRFVRFSRPGASPLTVSTAALSGAGRWTMPDPQAGGELFVRVASAAILPDAFRLTGPWSGEISRTGGSVAVPGLLPGVYAVRPVYQGGLEGQTRAFTIDAERSTFVFLAPEPVAQASIKADAASCADATALKLNRLRATVGSDGSTVQEIVRTTEVTDCRWTVAGLPKGEYEALLETVSGSGGRQAFAVEPQQIVQVSLERPSVSVSGRVTYNDQPVTDATVDFMRPGGGDHAQATTDSAGAYAVTLSSAGDYYVAMHDETLMPQPKRVTFKKGAQTLD